ncbi:MAG: hypothetical protein AAF335_01180 [Bacteroidota bacterium]
MKPQKISAFILPLLRCVPLAAFQMPLYNGSTPITLSLGSHKAPHKKVQSPSTETSEQAISETVKKDFFKAALEHKGYETKQPSTKAISSYLDTWKGHGERKQKIFCIEVKHTEKRA